jgi:hypothetical protein
MFPRLTEDTAVKVNLGLLITIISFLAIGGFTVGRVLTNIDDRVSYVESTVEEHDELRAMIEANSSQAQEVNIRLVRIETDTNWIRMTLEEMKGNR